MFRWSSIAVLLTFVVVQGAAAAEPAKTAAAVFCVDGAQCAWLEPLGERLALRLFTQAKVAPLEQKGRDVLRACRKDMSPVEADACVRDATRGAVPGFTGGLNRVVLHLWTENGEVIRGSAQIVREGKAESVPFTLVPVDGSNSLRSGFGTPEGNSRFVLRGGLGTVAATRGLAAPVERIPIQVLPEVRIFGELVIDPPPVR
jgi:hypothetical protein